MIEAGNVLTQFFETQMDLQTITAPSQWDAVVSTLPYHHILQSWAWGEFKGRWGWQATRWYWRDEEKVVAAAQLLRRAIPRTPFGIGYIPKGPLFDDLDLYQTEKILGDIERLARQQKCLFVKIDPDVHASHTTLTEMLSRRGWVRGEPIQFPNTGITDVRPSEASLLAQMKQKTRYNIRLAGRRGTTVRRGAIDEYPTFYRLYAETAARDGFLIRPESYYLDLWRSFQEQGLGQLLLAEVGGEPVAGLVLFHYGQRAWYFYGASSNRQREAMPNYALQWAALQWTKAAGLAEYDWWGAPDDLNDLNDDMAGVWRFKEGFGAQFREQIGAWDYPVNKLGYQLYTQGIPRLRALLRRGGDSVNQGT